METPIRILQRPCQIAVDNSSEVVKPLTTPKSLEQREADYAAARRRIMGSDTPEQDDDLYPTTMDTNDKTVGDIVESVVTRLGPSVANHIVTTATPLMSIQATPSSVNGFKSPDLRFPIGASVCLPSSNGLSRNVAYSARQGLNTGCIMRPQQQPQSALNGTRPSHQPQRLLTASNSSPSLLSQSSRIAQPIPPLFPAQLNSTPNAGLLPTPPGFGFPAQTTTAVDNGFGLHHSQSAAFSLMQQFGLLQQQYQQPLNGFHRLISPFSHTNASLNALNYTVAPLSATNQKHGHPQTFN